MVKVSNVDEAIELANGRRYGPDAAIIGKDINKIRKLIRYLQVLRGRGDLHQRIPEAWHRVLPIRREERLRHRS